ncbi:MAG: DUF1501 domain-containing protein [Synechococcus sp.]
MQRRHFLQIGSVFTASALSSLFTQGWTLPGLTQPNRSKRLLVIFLRGGIDSLNVVVPYGDSSYYEARPSLAIAPPGQEDGVLPLSDGFGLHPALSELMPFWENETLAFVHACGLKPNSRSHFVAQDYLETGMPGDKSSRNGWLNRLVELLAASSPVNAVNFGPTTPLILRGSASVSNFQFEPSVPFKQQEIAAAFTDIYAGNEPLSLYYQQGLEEQSILAAELERAMHIPIQNAPPARDFSKQARRLALLLKGDAGLQVAFTSVGGWDSHASGPPERFLRQLGAGLAELVKTLGSTYRDTAIVLISEFGRTVEENGNQGTDHGHGGLVWVLGGNVRGGKVYGEWPGLAPSQRLEGRGLNITTDARDAIASVLAEHFQLDATQLATIFPNHIFQPSVQLV